MGSPDISNLPVLAQCLDVSVHEILSGVQKETDRKRLRLGRRRYASVNKL